MTKIIKNRWISFDQLPPEVKSLGKRRVLNQSTRGNFPPYRKLVWDAPETWSLFSWQSFCRLHNLDESWIDAQDDVLVEEFDGEPTP